MFEEFREVAEKALQKITHYEETDDAFIFYNDELEQDGVVVILKENAVLLSMMEYIVKRSPASPI